jgi:DNA-binding response OmpR family regulator
MGGKKIVIVDDDVLLTRTLDILLVKKGYDVRVFNRGVDAVTHFFRESPDIVLLNSKLADCNCSFIIKLLGKLENLNNTNIILLSVIETDSRMIEGIENSVFLQKPFDTGRLLEIIDRMIDGRYLSVKT